MQPGPRVAAGEIAPVPEELVEALVIGPVAEATRRWLSGTSGTGLAQAARVLPDRIWCFLRPDPR
ncbi:hypothetical protein [Streptomyces sp. NPDC008122]|uniref:hypothetical protein n=1 Tax=Streptomyces sp. NPDC008122 TaxID=3364810 RepID=UPI0036F17E31